MLKARSWRTVKCVGSIAVCRWEASCKRLKLKARRGLAARSHYGTHSALIHFPIAFAPRALTVIAQLQQPVFGVVPLAATGTLQIAGAGRTLAVVVFGNGKSPATAAWHQIH